MPTFAQTQRSPPENPGGGCKRIHPSLTSAASTTSPFKRSPTSFASRLGPSRTVTTPLYTTRKNLGPVFCSVAFSPAGSDSGAATTFGLAFTATGEEGLLMLDVGRSGESHGASTPAIFIATCG